MSKPGLIFPLCFLILSGCALSENPEIIADKSETVNPVTESRPMSEPLIDQRVDAIEPPAVTKRFSVDEIRRIQAAMKEIGLDPGSVDGIAGGKTRIAIERLQSGCSGILPLLENLAPVIIPGTNKTPSRQETLMLQKELRKAGFNPGPADGIFGAKTKAVAAQLYTHCPTAHEYATALAGGSETAKAAVSSETGTRMTKASAATNPAREEFIKPTSAPVPAASQEEIRILQLRLRDAGFDPGPFDGVMGPRTLKALEEFQAAQRAGKIKPAIAAGIGAQY
jgi:peptidoglycan hydrolase-like protein with peptidoglycan-binding domain